MSKRPSKTVIVTEKSGIGFFTLGLLIGGLSGVIAALLNAPQSGRATREQIVGAAEDTVDNVRERIEGESAQSIIAAGKAEARRVTNDYPVGNPKLN